jgi:hypothetical protein
VDLEGEEMLILGLEIRGMAQVVVGVEEATEVVSAQGEIIMEVDGVEITLGSKGEEITHGREVVVVVVVVVVEEVGEVGIKVEVVVAGILEEAEAVT